MRVNQRGAMGDRNGGLALAFGISPSLLRRERTGKGSVVDVSLLAVAMWTLSSDLLAALQGRQPRATPRGTPIELHRAPEHGEHTEAILLGLGYSWEQIAELKQAGAVP
jgi:crotonobetainyl-CoA:carnitine CoA-transferase CaiB-like acyl-CoA transferase